MSAEQDQYSPKTWFSDPCWFLVALSVIWCIIVMPAIQSANPVVLFLFALVFALVHGIRRYGFKGIGAFFTFTWIISNAFENCSILTGFPFGHYHYTAKPLFFLVPWLIGAAYIAIGYVSWQTANALLDQADTRLKKGFSIFLLPAVAATVMTMFDFSTDPISSTLQHTWIWEKGGEYFGVPYTNFAGWLLVTYLFFQSFAFYLRFRSDDILPEKSRSALLQPVVLYFNLGFIIVIEFLTGNSGAGTFIDGAGITWNSKDIRSAMLTAFISTSTVMTLLAIARIYCFTGLIHRIKNILR